MDSLRLCIYYPGVLPHVVFTDAQFLIDCLSNIVRVSFIDHQHVQQILPQGAIFSDEVNDAIQKFKRDGVFDELFLKNLGLTFVSGLFSKSDLLLMLERYYLISPVKSGNICQYFMPILLPDRHLDETLKKTYLTNSDPLVITMKKLIPQVSHYSFV